MILAHAAAEKNINIAAVRNMHKIKGENKPPFCIGEK